MRKVFRCFTLLTILSLCFVLLSPNGNAAVEKHFKMSAQPSVLTAKSGDKFWIKLTINFEKGWHSYSTKKFTDADGLGPEATVIKVEPKSSIVIDGKMKLAKVKKHFDEAFEMNIEYLDANTVFEIPVTAKKDLDFSKDKINVVAYMQQCNDQTCLPPEDFKVLVGKTTYKSENTATVAEPETPATTPTVEPAAAHTTQEQVKETPKDAQKAATTNEAKPQEKADLLTTLILSMLAGFGAFITPCVFPMVPITVSFFTKRNEQNKGKGLRDALIYGLGIIVTFTSIGLVFSLLLGPTGVQEMAGSPWFNIAIVGVFLLFGFSLFGAYELQLPTSWTNKLNTKSNSSSGVASVILMSVTFALTSFSCTGPLIGAALVSASSGEWFYPMVSMMGFSTTLAAPFFLLALFPSALNSMPKAGGWMNNVKVILGFVVLAITLKYLNNALIVWNAEISREFFLSVWASISFLATIYVLGLFKTAHDSPVNAVSTIRLMFGLLFATLTFYLIVGLVSNKQLGFLESMLPAMPETEMVAATTAGGAAAPTAKAEWMHTYKEALADAKKENRTLLVDFTGKTCTNCKMMEKKLYPNPQIQAMFQKFSRAKLYTDLPENKDIQLKMFNSVALPLYALINPADESIIATITYTDSPEEFMAFLNKGLK